jgi:uncharacterized protein YjbI with pentapeptide repeats
MSRRSGAAVADEEAVKRLKQGFAQWNAWRNKHGASSRPDLIGAELSGANLRGSNLSNAYLSSADLTGADLIFANLTGANLSNADLTSANLTGADLSGANLRDAYLSHADLTGADLSGANLRDANLIFANLTGANLSNADLTGANLSNAGLNKPDLTGANLRDAYLSNANLTGADLSGANLTGADLSGTNLRDANLIFANLTEAILQETIFGDVDLTGVIGLETCRHRGPSIIDHRALQISLQISKPLPVPFLRGVGLPDRLIDYLPSLFDQAIQYFSCFISYSSKDKAFAERLHADLQNNGVRCWFAPHDMPIGAKIIDALDEAIRLRDKVLLILSEDAIASYWVEGEVTRALDEERTRKHVVLFPVRIDDAVMQTSEAWARLLRGQRNIGNFTRWKEHDSYQTSFDRLMRDLRVTRDP